MKTIKWSAILICEITFAFIGIVFTAMGTIFGVFIDEIAANPNSHGNVYVIPWIFCTIGIAFLLTFAVLFIISKKKKNKLNKLIESNSYINATVTEINQNLYVKINNRHPYYVICEGINPYTGEKLSFKSSNIIEYPSYLTGKTLRVFLDFNNTKDYFVEINRNYEE